MSRDRVHCLLFATIHDVLKAEKRLKTGKVDVEVVPVPRSLSSDCGVCIKSSEPAHVLLSLLGDIAGLRCFVFDGTEYRQEGLSESK
ncbi:MAG: DUF3343 domain-containing protein [Syntrophorhabdales bacterium]